MGTGIDIFINKVGRTLRFKKIRGTGAATVTEDANGIIVDVPVTADQLVKVSNADTTASYLENKLIAGTGISVTKLNPGANEQLRVAYSGPTGKYKTTSVTNIIPVMNGSPTFTVDANLDYAPYVPVTIQDINAPNNKIYGLLS